MTVEMDSDVQSAVNSRRAKDKIWGYTVCLFADNGQDARVTAKNNHNKIKDLMPYEFSEVTYENPFFKVYVGRCLNRTEAVRLLGRVKGEFPRAIISVKEFDVAVFGEERIIPDTIMIESPELGEVEL